LDTIANALVPLVILLAAGQGLRRSGFVEPGFWSSAEKLAYYLLMPLLLVRTIGRSDVDGMGWIGMVGAVYGAILSAAAALVVLHLIRGRPQPRTFTSVFQGGVRYNAYIALALAESLYGTEGIAIGALISGFMIIIINILCVTVLSLCASGGRVSTFSVIGDLAKNPLILGCIGGGLLNVSNIPLPVWADDSLAMIGRMALPIALLCIGASLDLSRLKGDVGASLIASVAQFGLKPIVAWAFCLWLGLPAMSTAVVVLFLAVPTAPSAYILARRMGGDHEAMASIIAFQTVAGFATMPLTMLALGV
jgi:predicted permease